MDNLKLPIALVVAMVLQISGGVWWVSQQAATIANLEETVSQLGSKMAIEDNVNLKRDVSANAAEVLELWDETEDLWGDIDSLTATINAINGIKQRIAVLENEFKYLNRDHDKLVAPYGSGHPMEQ